MENTMHNNAITVSEPEKNLSLIRSYGNSPFNIAQFNEMVGKDAPKYIASVLIAVRSTPGLMNCEPESIFSAALRAASLKLGCDPSLGHAFLIPFKNRETGISRVQLVVGYKGLYQIALRTGKYRIVNVATVYSGQLVDVDVVTGTVQVHGFYKAPKNRIGNIAYFELKDGYSKALYMPKDEIHEHAKRYSKAYSKKDGLWQTNPEVMEKKTVLRLLLTRWGFLDPMANTILTEEDRAEEANGADSIEVSAVEPEYIESPQLLDTGFNENEYLIKMSGERPRSSISIDDARAITVGTSSITYGDKPISELADMLPKIESAIQKTSNEEYRINLERKRDSILAIFEYEREKRGLNLRAEKFF